MSKDKTTQEWQPIKTAPKNGTEIRVKDCYGRLFNAWYNEYWVTLDQRRLSDGKDYEILPSKEIDPIAWMPLPKPPKQ